MTIYLGSDVGLREGTRAWVEMLRGVDQVTLVVHAVATHDLPAAVAKARSLLDVVGSRATLALGDPPPEPEPGHLIYLAGGNTFTFLDTLRRRDLFPALRRHVEDGRVYGGSAGALVLGETILAARRLDVDEIALRDLRGLDVLGGWSVYPHWTWRATGRLHWPASTTGVVELPDGACLKVEGGTLTSVGRVPVRLRRRGRPQAVHLVPEASVPAHAVGWDRSRVPV